MQQARAVYPGPAVNRDRQADAWPVSLIWGPTRKPRERGGAPWVRYASTGVRSMGSGRDGRSALGC